MDGNALKVSKIFISASCYTSTLSTKYALLPAFQAWNEKPHTKVQI